MDQIDEYGISIYPLPDCDSDEDEDYREQCRQLKVGNFGKRLYSRFLDISLLGIDIYCKYPVVHIIKDDKYQVYCRYTLYKNEQ